MSTIAYAFDGSLVLSLSIGWFIIKAWSAGDVTGENLIGAPGV